MPSKRFWAKQNPELDHEETVTKTKNILLDFKFKKIIHISSISARCQLNTIYGKNKKISEELIQKTKDYLIVRFAAMYGKGLTKGVLIDMINNNEEIDKKINFFNTKIKKKIYTISALKYIGLKTIKRILVSYVH